MRAEPRLILTRGNPWFLTRGNPWFPREPPPSSSRGGTHGSPESPLILRATRRTRAGPPAGQSPAPAAAVSRTCELEHCQVPVHFPLRELDPVFVPLLPLELDVAVEDVRAEGLPGQVR